MERLPWDEWLRTLGLERVRLRPRLVHLRPQMTRAYRLLRAAARLGVPGSVAVPPELLPIGARALGQGYLNRFALPLLNHWLLPRWMREQARPDSPTFVPRSVTNIMVNQTARNWTALGLPGHNHPVESTVDRWGLLTPVPGGPSLDWWVEVEGNDEGLLAASLQGEVTQRLQGDPLAAGGTGLTLPVVATAFEAGGLRVYGEAWILPAERADWAALQVVLFNIADIRVRGRFYFALRPYNPEGISPVYRITWDGQTLRADGRAGPLTWPQPQGWALSDLRSGDLFALINRHEPVCRDTSLYDPHGFAHGVLEYSFSIEPWEEAEFLAFTPVHVHTGTRRLNAGPALFPVHAPISDLNPRRSNLDPLFYSRAKAATTLAWRELLGCGMRISVPDRRLQESWEANQAHLLALHDGEEITPGPDIYHAFWFRDATYMAYALSACGHANAAAELLRGFLKRQRLNGVFVSQQGEWDSTGQVLWVIARHLTLHPDEGLEAELLPAVDRGARWIVRTLSRSPHGLMPPGISSEHLGPPDRYYWDNLWSLAGLEAACELIGPASNRPFEEAATSLRHTLEALWQADIERTGRRYIPAAPGRGADLGMVGSLVAWFPLGLLPPDSPLLCGTLQALQEVTFHDGMLFVGTGHSGWGTYLNMRIAGCYLMQGREGATRGWQMMRWLLRHASPTYNWPEAIHPVSGGGSAGDGQHGWASAEWLLLVRALLLHDTPRRLVLTPALPDEWLDGPGELTVERAPTLFGPLSYRLSWERKPHDSGEGRCLMRMALHGGWRAQPPEICWQLPGALLAARIDGAELAPDRHDAPGSHSLRLPADAATVEALVEVTPGEHPNA